LAQKQAFGPFLVRIWPQATKIFWQPCARYLVVCRRQ